MSDGGDGGGFDGGDHGGSCDHGYHPHGDDGIYWHDSGSGGSMPSGKNSRQPASRNEKFVIGCAIVAVVGFILYEVWQHREYKKANEAAKDLCR